MFERKLDQAWTWLGDKLKEGGYNLATAIYENVDYAIIVAMVLLLFVVFGSKKAGTYLWWTFACYIIISILGGYVL